MNFLPEAKGLLQMYFKVQESPIHKFQAQKEYKIAKLLRLFLCLKNTSTQEQSPTECIRVLQKIDARLIT